MIIMKRVTHLPLQPMFMGRLGPSVASVLDSDHAANISKMFKKATVSQRDMALVTSNYFTLISPVVLETCAIFTEIVHQHPGGYFS